jgi:aspartate/glutamate racemase
MTGITDSRHPLPPDVRLLGLIHTVGTLRGVFGSLATELLPDVTIKDIVDESLLQDAITEGGMTPEIEARLTGHVESLARSGVAAVMVTCSSMGQAVDRIGLAMDLPVLRVDTAMVEQALLTASRVGVLATLRTTMTPTVELVRERAAAGDRHIEIVAHLCEGAFEALRAGDLTRHDALVREGLRHLEQRVDVVVLAQASMARVLIGAEVTSGIPILTSPRLAMQRLVT